MKGIFFFFQLLNFEIEMKGRKWGCFLQRVDVRLPGVVNY